MIPGTIARWSVWRLGLNLSDHVDGGHTLYFIWHDRPGRMYRMTPLLRLP